MANNSGKGTEYEYSVCEMFSKQGYFTRRAIPVVSSKKQDITDIDVFGIKYTYPFDKKTIICDCKNKARSKPFERIFWTKGLAEYINVDATYIALPKVNRDIVEFAKRGDVRIIAQNELMLYGQKQIGYSDFDFYSEYFSKLEDKKVGDRVALKYLLMLKQEYLSDNPYTSLNIALLIVNKLLKEKISIEGKKAVFAEAITVVAYSLLEICKDVFGMSIKEREAYILNKLTYGDSDEEYINDLIRNVTCYANEMLVEKIPKEYLHKNIIDILEVPTPHYAKNCVALIERAYNNPEWYIDILRNLDFILYEFVLKNKNFDLSVFGEYNRGFLVDEKLKACKNVLYFVCSMTSVSLETIWTKEEGFIPSKN